MSATVFAMRAKLIPLILLSLVAGCNASNDLPAAEAGAASFHQMLNAGQSAAIYAASGPDMKKASSEADMVALWDAVHRKLGAFQSEKVAGWNESATTSGNLVWVSYSAKYDNATVSETFGWQIVQGRALLRSYFVNSTYLVIH